MKILDGKAVSLKVKESVKVRADELNKFGVEPTLAVVLVGEDKASQTYVRAKEKACNEYGIKSVAHRLSENTTQNELLALINVLNLDDSIHGILVQLPLPKHIDTNVVLAAIDPRKDVDGFHAVILKEYGIDVAGLNAVVIGRSNIVGKPMANLLLNASATVTVTHSKTKNLKEICKNADLIVAAIGKPFFLKADMVKDGAVVVDVGINRLDDGRLVGDVDFEEVAPKCSYITPVPGGVGPMTIAMLLNNTILAAQAKIAKN